MRPKTFFYLIVGLALTFGLFCSESFTRESENWSISPA